MSKINIKRLLLFIAVPLCVGILAALICKDDFRLFQSLNKPPLAPPAWLFPVVWSILYILMGISSYIVYSEQRLISSPCMKIYFIQLFVNFMWTILFFKLEQYLFSFIWIIILLFYVAKTAVCFCNVNKKSGLLQIPYIVWICFAGYLNIAVYYLNK